MLQKLKEKRVTLALTGVIVVVVIMMFLRGNNSSVLDQNNPLSKEISTSEFIAASTAVTGVVTSLDAGARTMVVSTSVADISGAEETIVPALLPEKVLMLTVTTNEATIFQGKQFESLIVGDVVTITSGADIYSALDGMIAATGVISTDQKAAAQQSIAGDRHTLIGFVRSMENNNALAIEAEVPDMEKLKTLDLAGSFDVPYVTRTFWVTPPSNSKDIKVGRMVRIETKEDVYGTDQLTAISITVLE